MRRELYPPPFARDSCVEALCRENERFLRKCPATDSVSADLASKNHIKSQHSEGSGGLSDASVNPLSALSLDNKKSLSARSLLADIIRRGLSSGRLQGAGCPSPLLADSEE
jgi:hypothetical protein